MDCQPADYDQLSDPYFFLKKSAKLTLGGSLAGRNLLTNAVVAENAATANIAVSGSLLLKGGSVWATGGKSFSFVPSTLALYNANNFTAALTAFAAGVPIATANPIAGEGVYIFNIVNGTNPTDVYYGMIKVVSVTPGVSVAFEYRIGNLYTHLAVIQ